MENTTAARELNMLLPDLNAEASQDKYVDIYDYYFGVPHIIRVDTSHTGINIDHINMIAKAVRCAFQNSRDNDLDPRYATA